MTEIPDKYAQAFAKLSTHPKKNSKTYMRNGKNCDEVAITNTFITRYRTGYSCKSGLHEPVDDARFIGKFGLMDKFLLKIPECVLRAVWLHYLNVKDIARLDIAVCGGMRKRFRQALCGFPVEEPGCDISCVNYRWFAKHSIVLPHIRIHTAEGSLAFLGDSLRWLRSLDVSHCTRLDDSSTRMFAPGSLPNLYTLNISFCSSLSQTSIEALLQATCRLIVLKAFQVPAVNNELIMSITRHAPQLQILDVGCSPDITDEGVAQLAQTFNVTLQGVNFSYCRGISLVGYSALSCCGNLTQLRLENCMDGLSDHSVSVLAAGCTRLTHFDVSGCSLLTDLSFFAIAENCHELQELGWFISVPIGFSALRALSTGCRDLAVLGFELAVDISPDEFSIIAGQFRKLRKLKLCSSQISDEHLLLLASAEGGGDDGSLYRGCKPLQEFHLSCRESQQLVSDVGVIALCRSSPMLTHLSLRDCEYITDEALVALAFSCPSLVFLRVSGVHMTDSGLSSLARGCALLEELTIFRAASITDDGVEYIWEQCMGLRFLAIDGCVNVSTACILELARDRPHVSISISNQMHQ